MTDKQNKICAYKGCNKKPWNNDKFCIFHSQDIESKKDEFEEAFWAELERQKKEENMYIFSGFVFPDDFSFRSYSFDKTVFFNLSLFYGEVDFSYAYFTENLSFLEAQFNKKASFFYTTFKGDVLFASAHFIDDVDFIFSRFSKSATFCGSRFQASSNFSWAEFLDRSIFGGIEIGSDVVEGVSDFHMNYTYFANRTDLFDFIESNKKKFSYSDKQKFLPDNFKISIEERTKFDYPIISRQIQDDIYLSGFKVKHPNIFKIWWLFADCGRSILRWALWSILFALFFAFIYHNIFYLNSPSSFNPENIHSTWPGFSFIYYSVVTFTTLGFGNIVPKPGWLQFWVMLEVTLGYIMLGGLISIFANKLARRS